MAKIDKLEMPNYSSPDMLIQTLCTFSSGFSLLASIYILIIQFSSKVLCKESIQIFTYVGISEFIKALTGLIYEYIVYNSSKISCDVLGFFELYSQVSSIIGTINIALITRLESYEEYFKNRIVMLLLQFCVPFAIAILYLFN